MVNVQLLERTMQHIKDNPEQHDQNLWCGTAQCFAGWAAHFTNWDILDEFDALVGRDGEETTVEHAAIRALGLTWEQAQCLFCSRNSIYMLELMVKDLANDGTLRPSDEYRNEQWAMDLKEAEAAHGAEGQ